MSKSDTKKKPRKEKHVPPPDVTTFDSYLALVDRSEPGVVILRYGGMLIPNGPGHGTVRIVDGKIAYHKRPNNHVADTLDPNNLESIDDHIAGKWRP